MDFIHFSAGKDDEGRRLDKIMRRFLSEESLSSLYKSLRKGLIKINGKKCDVSYHVSEDDDIAIAAFLLGTKSDEKEKSKAAPLSQDIIVFKNEALLFLNKPYDIPVHPSSSSRGNSLAEIVQGDYDFFHEKSSLSFHTGPLHRLDRKTTGIIAFSQNLDGAKWFSETIKNHLVQKKYLALLQGNLQNAQFWKDSIKKEDKLWGDGGKSGFHTVSVNQAQDGKEAVTEVKPLEHGILGKQEITLAEIIIKTGRTHQIRSQTAFHGFPLVGDTAYGGIKISGRMRQDFFLHAWELTLPENNPFQLPKKIKAPLGEAFLDVISESGIQLKITI